MNVINPILDNVICIIVLVLLGILFFVIYPAFRIIASHFDKEFPFYAKNKDVFENGWWIASKSLRGARYASGMMFKNDTKKRPFFRVFFPGYDFRKNACKTDWIILFLFLGWMAGMLILALMLWVGNGFHLPKP